ncbi:MAG TPA: methyltransferase domain-containing protein [bacterium]|nr:methyltransferase domain-containing protein [bacterium]
MDEKELIKMINEVFGSDMPRLGPGENVSTQKALDILSSKGLKLNDPKLRVIDIGCGNGIQTLEMAKRVNGTILAVDNHEPYLNELRRRAEVAGVDSKISTLLEDMAKLTSKEERFDLVWSEGALFCMGFREGIAACYSLLAPGGMAAATELVWLQPDPPEECFGFFNAVYPPMTTVGENLRAIRSYGFEILDHFTLSEMAWRDNYLSELGARLPAFREKYSGNKDKLEFIDLFQKEIDIYEKYSSWYGYEFFLMQK